MAKHRIYFQTIASTSIEVEVRDDVTDPHEIVEAAFEQDLDFPTLCHQCVGGTRFQTQNLELGDEWEPVTRGGKPIVDPA